MASTACKPLTSCLCHVFPEVLRATHVPLFSSTMGNGFHAKKSRVSCRMDVDSGQPRRNGGFSINRRRIGRYRAEGQHPSSEYAAEDLLEQLQAAEGAPQADILPTRLAGTLEARLLNLCSSISSQRALVSSTHECVGSCMYIYEHLKFRMDSITAVLASNPVPHHLEEAVARVAAQTDEDEDSIRSCSLHVENLGQLRRARHALDEAASSVTAVLEQVHTRVRGLSDRVEALDLCGSLYDLETRLANASHTMEVIGRHDALLSGIINGGDYAGAPPASSITGGGVGLRAGDGDGSEELQLRLERAVLASRLARGANRGGGLLEGQSPQRATSDQMLDIAYEVGVLENEVERTAGELDDIVKGLQAANKHVEMMGHKVERIDSQLWEHVEQLSLLEVVCGDLYWDQSPSAQ